MILVTICVSAALTLGLIIFVAVHCRRQVKACVQDSNRMQNGPRSLLWSLQDPLADRYARNRFHTSSWCCDNDVIADVATTSSEMASTPEDQICCSCVVHSQRAPTSENGTKVKKPNKSQQLPYETSANFEFLHADFSTLNTKSSFLGEDDDYFLSLSKDRRFLTPIPVSEL